jgi:hemerythrin
MLPMIWTPDLSVNVKVLDDDHKKVFAMINELEETIMAGHSKEVLETVLGRLMEYTMIHLAREEEFFAKTGYVKAQEHKKEHDRMIMRVQDIQGRFKDGPVAMLSLELRSFLQDWWIIHIQGSDKKYGACFNANGIF